MDGMRKCLAEEFSKIYVFNLRGNCRTSGEVRKKEAGNVFGPGSRTPIAVTILVKNPSHKGPAEIRYHDIGDYLSREEKLDILAQRHDLHNPELVWHKLEANSAGDWLNQRDPSFQSFLALGDKKDRENICTFFKPCFSNGLKTNRDHWCYNFSVSKLRNNIKKTIDFYNNQVNNIDKLKLSLKEVDISKELDLDSRKFSWDYQQKIDVVRSKRYKFSDQSIYTGLYRPFTKQNVYFNRQLNNRVYLLPDLFPTQDHENLIICLSGIGVTKEFSTIITNVIPDVQLQFNGQCFPRYHYEINNNQNGGSNSDQVIGDYIRHDAITDYILQICKNKYSIKITKDDIFYYIYGLLHSADYRRAFSADLKKTRPRLPLVERFDDFKAFSKAGRDLAGIHLNYEGAKAYGRVSLTGVEKGNFKVEKARFRSKIDKSIIYFNQDITISGIPLEAYDYVVNGRSPIEWVLERYQVKTDPSSGLKNDPNDWGQERGQPRYILDLILRVITVSLETVKIVQGLPKLSF
jgi:predicted helicase